MSDPVRIATLVVEDSRTQAKYLRRILENHDFEVHVATDGTHALQFLAEHRPDVVISDVVMPVMDGYELCRRMKADERLADIPVILVTSLAEPGEMISALEAGASNFLAKPYNEDTLIQRIHRTLQTAHENTEQNGSLEVDFAGRSYSLRSDTHQMIGFLLSTFGDTAAKNVELEESNRRLTDAVRTITRLESRYRQLMDTSVEAMLVVGMDRFVLYANRAAELLFHCGSESLVGTPFPFEINPHEPTEIELPLSDNLLVYAELRVAETQWGDRQAYLASLWDVTETVRLRERLRDLSLTDELTGLHNRRGFITLAEQQLKLAKRGDHDLVLLYADMDGLKSINDTHGHTAGDAALRETAGLLRNTLRESDILARMGGDEFAALLVDVAHESTELAIQRISDAFEERNARRTTPWNLGLSMGVVTYDVEHPQSLDDLTRQADALMYDEKVKRRAGRQ